MEPGGKAGRARKLAQGLLGFARNACLILVAFLVVATARSQETWTQLDPGFQVLSVALDPSSPQSVYAGVSSGVAKSIDGGESWATPGGALPGPAADLIVDPSAPSTLYAVSGGDVYKSDDAAASWRRVYDADGRGGYGVSVRRLALDAAAPATLYAAIAPYCFLPFGCESGGSLEKSVDGGATWAETYPGRAYDVAVSGSKAYAVIAGGLIRSVDGGSWISVRPPSLLATPLSIAVDPSDSSTLYLGTTGQGVFRSRDAGLTWSVSASGLQDSAVRSLAVDPLSSSVLYAGTPTGVFRSVDGGETWYRSQALEDGGVSRIVVAPSAPTAVYAVGGFSRLYRATYGSPGACAADATHLCLGAGRFRVAVSWRALPGGTSGAGRAVSLTSDTGYFWFFEAGNVELVVKALDGTSVNDRFWIFGGVLSDVEYTLVVTDTATGQTRVYFKPQSSLSSFGDTSAFPDGGLTGTRAAGSEDVGATTMSAYLGQVEACVAGPTRLCVKDGRFQVAVAWRTGDGLSGSGRAVPMTADTGYFWFFGESNVELVLKVLDGRSVNGHHWVFYGALSDVAYTVTVTDTQTGIVRTYDNPQGTLASHADTEAF